jgi:hypothetical protein
MIHFATWNVRPGRIVAHKMLPGGMMKTSQNLVSAALTALVGAE